MSQILFNSWNWFGLAVFDDIFDTTDEDTDETREEEEVPLIPAPTGFQVMCLEILELYKLHNSTYDINFGKSAILKWFFENYKVAISRNF